jgi:hypothetical protein
MSIKVLSIARMRSDSSRQVASASRCAAGSPDSSARSARPRRRVSDVVERVAHALDQQRDALEHLVEQRAQLVDRIPLGAHRHARLGPAGRDDLADGLRQAAQRQQGRSRHDHAAAEPHDHDRDRRERGDRPKPCEQLVAVLGALADLQQRAVGQPG